MNVKILCEPKYGIVFDFKSKVWCSKLIIDKFEYTSTSNLLKAAMCRFYNTCNNSIRVFPRFLEGLDAMVVCVCAVDGEGCLVGAFWGSSPEKMLCYLNKIYAF